MSKENMPEAPHEARPLDLLNLPAFAACDDAAWALVLMAYQAGYVRGHREGYEKGKDWGSAVSGSEDASYQAGFDAGFKARGEWLKG